MTALWLAAALLAMPALAAELESFSPLGLTDQVSQVRARFSATMAAPGQADAPAPFTVQCGPGHGYWVDAQTWVYDLAAKPAADTACTFMLRPDLRTLAGEPVRGAPDYQFRMAGPRVVNILPGASSQVDENQAYVLAFDAPVAPARLVESAHCAVQGVYERIPVRRLSGTERQAILAQPALREELSEIPDERLEVLQCQRPLPANARVALVWARGDYAAAGLPDPGAQPFNYEVRDHFDARLRCTRENARAVCQSLRPIRLEFSAPVARRELDRIALKDESGKSYRQDGETSRYDSRITFPGPFPPDRKLTLTLPEALRDDAGRALLNQDRFPLAVAIDAMPPLVKFAGDFGIVERQAGGLLPITLRNLEPGPGGSAAMLRWLRLDRDSDIAAWWQRLHDFDQASRILVGHRPRDRDIKAQFDSLLGHQQVAREGV